MRKKLYHQFACSSLILPQHRARLARHYQKKIHKKSFCQFLSTDEQQLEQLQHLANQSMHLGLPLKITFLDNGSYCTFTGMLSKQQPEPKRLRFRCGKEVLVIPITAIVSVKAIFFEPE